MGSDPTRIQFLDSTGPRIIPSYVNRGLCAPGPGTPQPRLNREGKSSNHSAVRRNKPAVKLREIDSFHAYGTVTKLTTVDGRIPDAQRWLPGAVSARLNIRVRSTTARMF